MKSTTIAALFGATLASAAFLAAPAILPSYAGAADADADAIPAAVAETPATPVNGREHYKIMSLAPFQNDTNTQRMEASSSTIHTSVFALATITITLSLFLMSTARVEES